MKEFNELPASIQSEVKNQLKAYDKCFVTYENATYHISPSIAITASYAVDHEVIGTYTQRKSIPLKSGLSTTSNLSTSFQSSTKASVTIAG